MMPLARVLAVCAVLLASGISMPAAEAQMPDPRAMNGLSIPGPELPDGTVSVRVVRDQITNNLSGVPVQLVGAGAPRTATTGEDGRALFEGVPSGVTVHAVATVDGQPLESRPFEVPAHGGIRTILVAFTGGGEAGGAPPSSAPAQGGRSTGSVSDLSIGANSRIATQFADDVLEVFYLLDIVNKGSAPVTPKAALTIELPENADGASLLEGSTKLAAVRGRHVTIAGPFAPGATQVQVAYRVHSFGPEYTLTQAFPLPLDMVAVAVQKVDGMGLRSPQVSRTEEATVQGDVYMMGNGPALPSGTPLTLQLTNLPYRSRLGEYLAFVLAAIVAAGAAWLALARGRDDAGAARRRVLETRRRQGLEALAALDRDRRAGSLDPEAHAGRRAALVADLERIYGELDAHGGPARDQGAAA